MTDNDRGYPSERTRVRRLPKRGVYDRQTLDSIIDQALIGHVGFVVDGSPCVIPMVVVRNDDDLLLHGSTASRLIRHLADGAEVCVSIVHLDGIVVARSVFDNSMNYRSAIIFGRADPLISRAQKIEGLRTIVDHLLPGRWDEARQPTEKELRATTILRLPLRETSAKVRSGPPQDDHRDRQLPVWAGEIPLRMTTLAPVPDPLLDSEIPVPESVRRFLAARARREPIAGRD
jgi:nitroimidazol reductase NimA-like FMN-containing flavoprotein (pyridoxamine 5'-phosphate oxidase superfamily)